MYRMLINFNGILDDDIFKLTIHQLTAKKEDLVTAVVR